MREGERKFSPINSLKWLKTIQGIQTVTFYEVGGLYFQRTGKQSRKQEASMGKKKKEQEREKQKLIKQEGNKYRAQSWLGIWGLAD